jgi:AraC-like DNA-binding protein
VAFLGLKALHGLASGSASTLSALLLHAAGFGLAAHTLWVAYEGRTGDLSEERRAFRMPFVVGVGAYSLVLVAAETVLAGAIAPAPLRIVHVSTIVLLALASALRLIVLRGDELLVPRPPVGPSVPSPDEGRQSDAGVDAAELARLNALMDGKQAWRHEGLTIGRLADQMGLPEYRLRRLINKGLGHRNFAAYLNSYRIEAARVALSDPTKRRLPVLTVALDLGFGSIGPFNRAFKEATGKTPTEFRRAHLRGGPNELAES